MTVKKKSTFSHPELSLLPLCRIVSQGGRDKEIDTYCRSVGAKDWRELFDKYPKFNSERAILDGASSNHPALNCAVGLCHSFTREESNEAWKRAAEMESSTIGFELNEPGSRIYKTWSLISRLIGYRELGPEWNNRYFEKWLRMYVAVELLSTITLHDGPFSLRCGARSQGVFDRTKSDYFISKVMTHRVATNWNWRWRTKPHPLPDQAWKKSDEAVCIDSLYDIYKGIAGYSNEFDFRHFFPVKSIVEICPSWSTMNPTHFYRTTEGLAVWCERADLNSNTPGISAMVYYFDERRLVTAPSPSRDHIRQKKVSQQIHFDESNRLLHFEQSYPGRPETLDIPLPSGDLVYHIYHGPNGLETRS